jgi:hypothetical protein
MAVGTALTVASIGIGAAQMGMGFSEAAKQQENKRAAELEIERGMGQALREQEKIYSEELSIQKGPYELEREAALVAGAQATEALRESERGMGRVGAIYGQQQQAQRQIASDMGQEMMGIDLAVVQEKAKRGDIISQIYLAEVAGQQMAAADAEEARAQAIQQGFQGAQTMVTAGLDFIPEASFDPAIAAMNQQERQARRQRRRFNRFDTRYGGEYINPYGRFEGGEAIIG